MNKISEKYKPVELRRIVKTLTDFLEENKLHYRLIITSPENETAFEWHEMTPAELFATAMTVLQYLHEEEGVPVGEILKLVEFAAKDFEKEGDKNV